MDVEQRGVRSAQTIEYFALDDPEITFGVGCRHPDGAEWELFCTSVVENSSIEFLNVFAYDVSDCVRAHGDVTTLRTGTERSGLVRNPHALEKLEGRLGLTDIMLTSTEHGFALTFGP